MGYVLGDFFSEAGVCRVLVTVGMFARVRLPVHS